MNVPHLFQFYGLRRQLLVELLREKMNPILDLTLGEWEKAHFELAERFEAPTVIGVPVSSSSPCD